MAEISSVSWKPLQNLPETDFFQCKFVDLLVRAKSSGTLFRVPDCFVKDGEWWSLFHHYPLRVARWEPVAWMPVATIPSEEELLNLLPPKGDTV